MVHVSGTSRRGSPCKFALCLSRDYLGASVSHGARPTWALVRWLRWVPSFYAASCSTVSLFHQEGIFEWLLRMVGAH